ncbi:hypothetical protein [Actinophytocola xinjiangensis]|uniref:hypothetical protein n=1 Tax=Actinophytocola xinjiangensis TaxID=485602 RepID=UPI000B1A2761|nr:hypothetical protein [Actinophytocola xinjiangensis]
MYLLSDDHRKEFLSTPEVARLTVTLNEDGPKPTLLIKARTLALKYLTKKKYCHISTFRVAEEWLGYWVDLQDDPIDSGIVWSLVEKPEEREALRLLSSGYSCDVIIFNELAIPVAHSEQNFRVVAGDIETLLSQTGLHSARQNDNQVAEAAIERIRGNRVATGQSSSMEAHFASDWRDVDVMVLRNNKSWSKTSFFATDEGRQQEEVGVWLVDSLHVAGSVHSPQVYTNGQRRELTDLLMTYKSGLFLIESKALAVFNRANLPSRDKLGADTAKHIRKAAKQLKGAIRSIRMGAEIRDEQGDRLPLESNVIPHAIILVPDLSLLEGLAEFGSEFFRQNHRETDSMWHILDLIELLRVVQAASEIFRLDPNCPSEMAAFDYCLMERAKRSVSEKHANFQILWRIG